MTSDDTPKAPARAVRADVRRNRALLLDAARETFGRDGADASLERIARLAGVGIGTLYRHFPARRDLLEALLADVYDGLAAEARALLDAPAPGAALAGWLRSFVSGVTAFPGMAAAAAASLREDRPDPSPAALAVREAGAALFARARDAGAAPAGASFADALRLAGGVAVVTERDPEAADRLLDLAAAGIVPGAAARREGQYS